MFRLPDPAASARTPEQVDKIRDQDVVALLEAGVHMDKLEELYGAGVVQRVCQAYIRQQSEDYEDEDKAAKAKHVKRNKLAALLFQRAPSTSLLSLVQDKDHVLDAVFQALVAEPDDPLLMDPLMMTPMKDPVVLSSGWIVDRSTAIDGTTGQLRLQRCPFSRQPLHLPVYDVLPLQHKLKEWEVQRLQRCVNVAETMTRAQQWDRLEQVLALAHGLFDEETAGIIHDEQDHPPPPSSILGDAASSPNNDNNYHTTNNNPTTFSLPMGSSWHPALLSQQDSSLQSATAIQRTRKHNRDILYLALQLASLEREIPGVKDDISRTVRIHQRLVTTARACTKDDDDIQTLLQAGVDDCWKRCSMLLAFGGKKEDAKAIRIAFAPLIKYATLMKYGLLEELQKLCSLDLTIAKHLEDEASLWNCRRIMLDLVLKGENKEKERLEFLREEDISGDEEELYFYLPYDASIWPCDDFVDAGLGLVHFGKHGVSRANGNAACQEAAQQRKSKAMRCHVDLNPHPNGGDHWIEVAFRADNIQSPGHLNAIFSQHGPETGWEIRCAVRPRLHTFFAPKPQHEGGIYVEAIWTTRSNQNPNNHKAVHNTVTNTNVPLEIGQWYHVVLCYHHATKQLDLYVNGVPSKTRVTVSGPFQPDPRLPVLGRNLHWPERSFQGWVAFAAGSYELPVTGAVATKGPNDDAVKLLWEALDMHAQRLSRARLKKLPRNPNQYEQEVLQASETAVSVSVSENDSSPQDDEAEGDDEESVSEEDGEGAHVVTGEEGYVSDVTE